MTVYTNLSERQPYFEEVPLSLSTTLSAIAQDTLRNSPTSAIVRTGELMFAEQSESSPLVPAEDARKRVADRNIRLDIPDDGIREAALNILINRKEKEIETQQILSQGPQGFGAGVAKLGTSFVTSLVDPLNVAAAFVPIVGEARYTAMLENAMTPLARAAVRAKVGAVEGLAGAVLVEPFVATAARYEQADYSMSQSLENIAFGALFGGGLHMGVGALHDAFFRDGTSLSAKPNGKMPQIVDALDQTTKTNALKSALSQLVEGRQVNIEPILMYDPRYAPLKERLLMSTSLTKTSTIELPFKGETPFVELGQFGPTSELRQEVRTAAPVIDSKGDITVFKTFEDAERIQKTIERRSGEKTEVYRQDDGSFVLRREFADAPIRDGSGNIFAFDTERQANKALDTILSLKDKNATPIPFYEDGRVRYTLFENASPEFIQAAKKDPTLVSFDNTKIDRWNDTSMLKTTEADQAARLQEAMRQAKEPAKSILGNVESSQQATKYVETKLKDEANPASIDAELDQHIQAAQETATRLGLESDYKQSMSALDELIADADAMARGIEAAASCGIRRG